MIKRVYTEKVHLEGKIDDLYDKYYFKTPREDFEKLIRIDPTFKEGVDKLGDYHRWLLKMAKIDPKVVEEDAVKIKEYLTLFHKFKHKIGITNIDHFRDIQSLARAVEPYMMGEEASSDIIELTNKELLSNLGKLKKEVPIIYEDSNWIVTKPKNYEQGCVFGAGTKWCTTYGSADVGSTPEGKKHFNQYFSRGPLIQIINKKDKRKKWQLLDEGGNSFHFMDKNDMRINVLDWKDDNNIPEKMLEAIIENT